MARLILTAAFGPLILAACGSDPPVEIDGTTQETFERTAAEARRQLPDADRLDFDRALRTVGSRRNANRDAQALARVTFDGMTAQEVVADQRQRD